METDKTGTISTKAWHRQWAREFFDDRPPTAEEIEWIEGRRDWRGAVGVQVSDLAALLAEAHARGVRDAAPRVRPIPEGLSTMRSDSDE